MSVKEYLKSINLDYDTLKNSYDSEMDTLIIHQRVNNRLKPKTSEEVKQFYFDMEYIFKEKLTEGLIGAMIANGNSEYCNKLFSGLFQNKNIRVLDFGCGNNSYAGYLAYCGYKNVDLADLPTIGFNYVKYCYKEANIPVNFIDLTEGEDKLENESYDFIVCSEVMEHIVNPVETLKYLVSKLKKGGIMYLSVFFDNLGGREPYHLAENNKYGNPDLWLRTTYDCGLNLLRADNNNVAKVYVKR